jgi:hypothetical protein
LAALWVFEAAHINRNENDSQFGLPKQGRFLSNSACAPGALAATATPIDPHALDR